MELLKSYSVRIFLAIRVQIEFRFASDSQSIRVLFECVRKSGMNYDCQANRTKALPAHVAPCPYPAQLEVEK